MDKKKLIEVLTEQLEKDRVALMAAAQSAYDAATGEESRPENEYDTRALEASYLAGAQAQRVTEIDELLALLKTVQPRVFSKDSPIAPTAMIHLDLGGHPLTVFMLPQGGGQMVKIEGREIQVVTPSSPLGDALLGLQVGDTALVEIGATTKEYEITGIE